MSASSCSREDDISKCYKVGRITVYRLNQVIKAEKIVRKIDGCADDDNRSPNVKICSQRASLTNILNPLLYLIPYGNFEGEPVWTGTAFDRKVCGHY
jgi:hypothetical protein